MRGLLTISILSVLLGSCTSESKEYEYKPDGSIVSSDGQNLEMMESGEFIVSNEKKIGNLCFGFREVTALEYVQRIGEQVSVKDAEELKKESVFMLEIGGNKPTTDILGVEEITMNEDDAVQYLIGKVLNDFSINQNGKKLKPQGVQYDGKIGSGDKLRLTFFVQGIDLNEEYTIEYYDRLFGKGLIKMKKNINVIS